MRLDHIAYRVANRRKTARFICEAFGYQAMTHFDIKFDDGSIAQCIALAPPEKKEGTEGYTYPWNVGYATASYHMPPEIFVSDGTPDSVVGRWVEHRDGVGGIHHLAYQVEDVRAVAKEWVDKGWGEFNGDVLTCPEDELDQIFTKPHPLTGVIYEFIKRGKHGFCEANVGKLMESTKDNDRFIMPTRDEIEIYEDKEAKDRPPLKVKFKAEIGEAVLDNRRIVLDKDRHGYYK